MKCEHLETKKILTPELTHYAKVLCATCGAFLRWLPKPETLERAAANAKKIEALKQKPLSEWEKSFALSLEKQGARHLSPKQQARLDEIFEKFYEF